MPEVRCYWCDREVEEFYWDNDLVGFCSLECTHRYLTSEGYTPISAPDESAKVQPEYQWDDIK